MAHSDKPKPPEAAPRPVARQRRRSPVDHPAAREQARQPQGGAMSEREMANARLRALEQARGVGTKDAAAREEPVPAHDNGTEEGTHRTGPTHHDTTDDEAKQTNHDMTDGEAKHTTKK